MERLIMYLMGFLVGWALADIINYQNNSGMDKKMKRTYWAIVMFVFALINFGIVINTGNIISLFVVPTSIICGIADLWIDKKLKEDWDRYLEEIGWEIDK